MFKYDPNLPIRTAKLCPLGTLQTYGSVEDNVLELLAEELFEGNKDTEMCGTPSCGLTAAGLAHAIGQKVVSCDTLRQPCMPLPLDETDKQ